MSTLFTPPRFTPVDGNSQVMPGALLYFYQTGTSTLLDTYSDSGLQSVNANPVVADSNGLFGNIYLGNSADYKVILTTSGGTTVWTVDPYFASSTAGRTAVADASYSATITDRAIAYTSLSVARTVTLPAASTFPAGTPLTIIDESGSASASVTISVARSASDTINGSASTRVVVGSAYGSAILESDGTSKWTLLMGPRLTPTVQIFTSGSAATYTRPASVRWIRVRAVGAGGGGGGCGNSTGPTGATGGDTSFNSVVAKGGVGGTGATTSTPGTGGAGGTAGTGTATLRITGQTGGNGVAAATSGITGSGAGGSSPFFGGGGLSRGGAAVATGVAGVANTGGGGSGAESPTNTAPAGGGGSGEYLELIIGNPAATYTYTVGSGGAGGIGTGTGAATGGAGAAGQIIVEEYYA